MILGERGKPGQSAEFDRATWTRTRCEIDGVCAKSLSLPGTQFIVCAPSRWEGLPTVLIEALYLGAPIIATDCPVVRAIS